MMSAVNTCPCGSGTSPKTRASSQSHTGVHHCVQESVDPTSSLHANDCQIWLSSLVFHAALQCETCNITAEHGMRLELAWCYLIMAAGGDMDFYV